MILKYIERRIVEIEELKKDLYLEHEKKQTEFLKTQEQFERLREEVNSSIFENTDEYREWNELQNMRDWYLANQDNFTEEEPV